MNCDYRNRRLEYYDKKGYDYKRLYSDDKSQRTVKERIFDNYNIATRRISNSFNATTDRIKNVFKKSDNRKKNYYIPEEKEWLLKEYNEDMKRQSMVSEEREWWEKKN